MSEAWDEHSVRIGGTTKGEAVLSAVVSVPRRPACEKETQPRKAVLLVHGMFGSGTAPGVVPTLAQELGAQFVVCRVDLTGNGESEGEWRYAAYDREVADVARARRFVRDMYGADTCAVVGHSKGGAVVLLYAATLSAVDRERCVFVTLGAKTVYDQGEAKFTEEELATSRTKGFFLWAKFGKTWRVTQQDLQERLELHSKMAAALGTIAPALVFVVHGTEDKHVGVDNADHILKHCPTARKHLIEGCGHYFRGYEKQMCELVVSWIVSLSFAT